MTQQRVSPVSITSVLPATVTLSVQGALGQSANLFEVKNSTGTVLANISSDARIRIGSTNSTATHKIVSATTGDNYTVISQGSGAGVFGGMLLQISEISRYAVALNSSGDIVFSRFNSSGVYQADSLNISSLGAITMAGFTAASIGLIVKGAASATADLQQWQSSAGSVLAKVLNTGGIVSASAVAAVSFNTSTVGFQAGSFNGGGYIRIEKATASVTTGSTTAAQLFLLTGTNANTVKLVIRSNGAETTILDNIPTT